MYQMIVVVIYNAVRISITIILSAFIISNLCI